jgi:glycosyltransferase involved in cell wall biosynthesis
LGLAKAVELVVEENPKSKLHINWYGDTFFVDGKPSEFSAEYLAVRDFLARSPARKHVTFLPAQSNVLGVYQGSSALCLPSFYEGCSNAICEALACGLPVLASRIPEHESLLVDNSNAITFDPHSPRSIADALLEFEAVSDDALLRMGQTSRAIAEEKLSHDRYVNAYIDLLSDVLGR